MPLNVRDTMELLARLADEEELRATVADSAQGGAIAGLSTFIGGLLLGPPGLLLGATVGGGVAYAVSEGQFQPVSEVILAMPEARRRQLFASVRHLVRQLDARDAVTAVMLLTGRTGLRSELIAAVVRFVTSQLNMKMNR